MTVGSSYDSDFEGYDLDPLKMECADEIQRVSDLVGSLKIVPCNTPEQKVKLKEQVFCWFNDLARLKQSASEEDLEVLQDSELTMSRLDDALDDEDMPLKYLTVVQDDKIQGVCSYGDYGHDSIGIGALITAPSNLNIKPNQDCIRGAGTKLLLEVERVCLLTGKSQIKLAPTSTAGVFYKKHKFVPLDTKRHVLSTQAIMQQYTKRELD